MNPLVGLDQPTRVAVSLSLQLNHVDLDSITSSILYAYLSSTPAPQSAGQHSVSGWPAIHIPILNIPSADISIRPELLHLLPLADIEPAHLITLDDLHLSPDTKPDKPPALAPSLTRWTLVDHNSLTGPSSSLYAARVCGCVDHHIDEAAVPHDAVPRIITPCGSCTSLVLEHCRPAWDALSSGGSGVEVEAGGQRTWSAQIARLALASVLVDTNGLRDAAKTTHVDRAAVDYLEAKVKAAPSSDNMDMKEFLEDVMQAKGDMERLTVEDVLRKDFKVWTIGTGKLLGIASVIKPLDWLARRVEAEGRVTLNGAVEAFGRDRHAAVFVIMTAFSDDKGKFRRELLVKLVKSPIPDFWRQFINTSCKQLSLEEVNDAAKATLLSPSHDTMRVWRQLDVEKSRKQVAPMLREMLIRML